MNENCAFSHLVIRFLPQEPVLDLAADVRSCTDSYATSVSTNGNQRPVVIPGKEGAPGPSVIGGELLFLALATCDCNDINREAARMNIAVQSVEVEVPGQFGGPGDPARDASYRVHVTADAPEERIAALILHTNTVAELQNTVRSAIPVTLSGFEASST